MELAQSANVEGIIVARCGDIEPPLVGRAIKRGTDVFF